MKKWPPYLLQNMGPGRPSYLFHLWFMLTSTTWKNCLCWIPTESHLCPPSAIWQAASSSDSKIKTWWLRIWRLNSLIKYCTSTNLPSLTQSQLLSELKWKRIVQVYHSMGTAWNGQLRFDPKYCGPYIYHTSCQWLIRLPKSISPCLSTRIVQVYHSMGSAYQCPPVYKSVKAQQREKSQTL